MTDEKLKKANELRSEITNAELRLSQAREIVIPCYRYSNGHTCTLSVKNEILGIIQAIVVAAFEKELAEIKAEYEAL